MGLTKDSKLASPEYVESYNKILTGTFNLAVDATQVINVVTALGGATEAANYDLNLIVIDTFITDTVAGSKTNGYLVDGSAVIATGFKNTGTVILHNAYVSSQTGTYRITLRRK